MFTFSNNSMEKLAQVHPDMVKVAMRAIELTSVDFGVIHGIRTLEEEEQAVASGHSQTMHSMHLPQPDGLSHAIDIAAFPNGKISWDATYYKLIATFFKQAAQELGIPIVWGGDWTTLKDWGHYELDQKVYNKGG
jgi:peptidoglycan LD-endopeptidase CwlK